MIRRTSTLLPVLLVALAPAAAPAQQGPSFNCRYASTRTEVAICGSPELAALERRMAGAYEGLAGAIGERRARAIADDLLIRRQACEGDADCIAERLLISEEVFRQRTVRAGGTTVAEAAPEPEEAPVPEAAPEPRAPEVVVLPDVVALAPEPAPPREASAGRPLAAEANWPLASAPIPPVRPSDLRTASAERPSAGDLGAALAGAELTSSDGAAEEIGTAAGDPSARAAFDTPLSWAWMDLPRADRAALQARLKDEGLYAGPADGAWTQGTRAAVESALADPAAQGFDLATKAGAALALDFLNSDAASPAPAPASEARAEPAAELPPAPEVAPEVDRVDW